MNKVYLHQDLSWTPEIMQSQIAFEFEFNENEIATEFDLNTCNTRRQTPSGVHSTCDAGKQCGEATP